MKHLIKQGKNRNVMILLHGTGGDAASLFELAHHLDPDATYIGFQGNVVEHGMNRFFARYSDNSFDLESLAKETYILKEAIDEVISAIASEKDRIILVAYSNGANIALNLLKEFEINWDLACLFHPSQVRPGIAFKKQDKLRILLSFGSNDPYVSEIDYEGLKKDLEESRISFREIKHEKGHSLVRAELELAYQMIHQ